MKQLKWMVISGLILGTISLNACKKDDAASTSSTPATETQMQVSTAEDESDVNNETNEVLMDVNVALTKSQFNGTSTGQIHEAIIGGDVLVDNSTKMATIKYDGRTRGFCSRIREGKVTIALTSGAKWSDAGAVLTITYEGFKSTKTCGGKFKKFAINGTTTVTNVLGGLACFMTPGDSIVYEINGSNSIEFNGKAAAWTVARRLTFTMHADGSKRVATDGIGPNNMVVWGKDRHDREFAVTITQTVKRNSLCGYDEPTAGVKVYSKLPKDITVTLGVDKSGEPVVAEDCSAYGFKIVWVNAEGKAIFYVNPYR